MESKAILDIVLKSLAALTLLFGAVFYAMKIIYKAIPLIKNGNGKKDPPASYPGPRPGEAEICRHRGEILAEIKTLLPRIDRAVRELYHDRFGVDPR